MSVTVVFQISGTRQAAQQLGLAQRHVADAVRQGVEAVSGLIATVARQRCPVDTGSLKASITHKVVQFQNGNLTVGIIGPDRGRVFMTKKGVRKPSRYAHLVEKGTAHAPAQPFLRPAADHYRTRYPAYLQTVIASALQSMTP